MNGFIGFLVYLGVIFLGIITVLFTIIAIYVAKMYKAGKFQSNLALSIEDRLKKISDEFKEIKDRIK